MVYIRGKILLEEFLKPMGISQNKLAVDIGVPPRRINEIVLENAELQQTLLCVSGVIWEYPHSCG
jgi:plasmid maintenance system antidote protein VapI